jgi:amino acid permease
MGLSVWATWPSEHIYLVLILIVVVSQIYTSMPEATPQKMNLVVKGAVNLCSGIYITIGFFGYLAFHTQDFGGNILRSFSPSTPFVG